MKASGSGMFSQTEVKCSPIQTSSKPSWSARRVGGHRKHRQAHRAAIIPALDGTRMTLLLSHDDLEHLLSLPDVIDAVEAAFLAHSSGKTVTPARGSVAPPGTGGVLL